MKIHALIVPAAVVAGLWSAPLASARGTDPLAPGDLAQRIAMLERVPADAGTGEGLWVSPTSLLEGRVAGVLLGADGEPAWTLDGTLTRYVFATPSARFEYGGLYGRIEAIDPENPLGSALVQGEWARNGAQSPNGEFLAIVFRSAPYPQSIVVEGTLRGTLQFAAPSAGAVASSSVASSIGTADPARSPSLEPGIVASHKLGGSAPAAFEARPPLHVDPPADPNKGPSLTHAKMADQGAVQPALHGLVQPTSQEPAPAPGDMARFRLTYRLFR